MSKNHNHPKCYTLSAQYMHHDVALTVCHMKHGLPWCFQVTSLFLEQLVQCADNSTAQTAPGAAAAQAGCNPALRNSSRALPLPLIVRAKNRVDTMRVPLRLNSFRELMSGPGAAAEPQPGPVSIYLQAHGRHTPFVCAYAVVLTLMCVAIGLYLTVMSLDQAFVRPRALAPATINTFAGGWCSMRLRGQHEYSCIGSAAGSFVSSSVGSNVHHDSVFIQGREPTAVLMQPARDAMHATAANCQQ